MLASRCYRDGHAKVSTAVRGRRRLTAGRVATMARLIARAVGSARDQQTQGLETNAKLTRARPRAGARGGRCDDPPKDVAPTTQGSVTRAPTGSICTPGLVVRASQ